MEEINLEELFKYFISKLKYIVLSVILSVILGYVYINYLVTPMYHSSTTLILVSNNGQQSSAALQSDVTLNKNLVTTYSEIVKSRSVLSQVIDKLKLKDSVSKLSSNIQVSSVENTEIIKIQVSDKNNKKAKKIADETSKVFMKEVQKIYNLTNVSVVDKASLETVPYNIHKMKQLFISACIGFIISSGIIFIIFYFDTTIKSSKDIEEKLGLAVIGNVAFVDNKGEK